MKARSIVRHLGLGAVLLCWAAFAWSGPLGELDIQGDVRLTMAGSGETVTLRNTSYTLFVGDRVATGSTAASLRMADGNSFGIGPNSELTLRMSSGALEADLQRGSLTYLLRSNGTPIRVNGYTTLTVGELGMVEADGSGELAHLQGRSASLQAEHIGLSVGDSGISVNCDGRRGCDENVRPRSLSP